MTSATVVTSGDSNQDEQVAAWQGADDGHATQGNAVSASGVDAGEQVLQGCEEAKMREYGPEPIDRADIDDGILPLVLVLNRKDVVTRYSCQGHEHAHGNNFAYVCISTSSPRTLGTIVAAFEYSVRAVSHRVNVTYEGPTQEPSLVYLERMAKEVLRVRPDVTNASSWFHLRVQFDGVYGLRSKVTIEGKPVSFHGHAVPLPEDLALFAQHVGRYLDEEISV